MIPQLLSPAGSFDCLAAALKNGANAVYFGVGKLNMRGHATANFRPEDLSEVVLRCHVANAKAWLTLNTLIYDEELEEAKKLCSMASVAGVDAIIAADPAVILMARELGLSVHLSVQANVCNIQSLKYHAQFADTIVLARELALRQIERICCQIQEQHICGPSGDLIKIEVFAHGALCMSVSGQCYLSQATFNRPASRGECFQNCRRRYLIKDDEDGTEFAVDGRYVLSPKDLCTIEIIDRLADAGVSVLKIEGRGRSADYVAHVTKAYREALDFMAVGKKPSFEQKQEWKKSLREVFNRGFWEGGYYLGEPIEKWGDNSHNQAILQKECVGTVLHYYPKAQIAEVRLTAGSLALGDRILITGNTTGAVETILAELQVHDKKASNAEKGDQPTFPIADKVRPKDKVYKLKEVKR